MDNKIVPFRSDDLNKMMPFPIYQSHCDERKFVYAGSPGRFDVYCRLGPERCNHTVCPVWNSDKMRPPKIQNKPAPQPVQDKSLREINLRLKKPAIKNEFEQQCEAHGIRRRIVTPTTWKNSDATVNSRI